ncbi:uncharacterized protein LOC131246693 [Magnolia sinica]|uniref:uncharacterized protein LOC131246693 n=1 Tax=Magnolia sinica TaxID=86752 RepID=UPI0026583BCD|nr:uncharacterized protein LOC131246693 [Magnolia sinica]
MDGTFNRQILVDKLAILNNSQQSIETLSHWCIFHMKNAKQVVETWDRQFHCSPHDQRVSFLYLANDILQNSRRKGAEFVGEFWKVLPDALSDVFENGDEFGRNAATRLVDIWEERKVFGSRGQILKEELLGRNQGHSNRNGKNPGYKLKQSVGNILEKIISNYEVVYDGPVDEDSVLSKCKTAISFVAKVEKDIGADYNSGHINGSELVELQGQHGILRECIEHLKSAESSRATLVSNLREALQEQEFKLEQLRNQLQVAQSRSEHAANISRRLLTNNSGQLMGDQRPKEATTFSDAPLSFVSETPASGGEKEQSAPVMYIQRGPSLPDNNSLQIEEDHRKTAAAAVAAKLAASTSSAQMLTYVLSSLASEGVIGNTLKESSIESSPSEKRPKLENSPTSYMPTQLPPPLPPFPHPESLHNKISASQNMSQHQPPPPHPSSSPMSQPGPPMQPPPPLPPLPPVPPPPLPSHFMQTAGSMTSVPYSYGTAPQRPPSLPGYQLVGTPISGLHPYPGPPNPYQNFQSSDGGFYSQPPLPAMPSQQ